MHINIKNNLLVVGYFFIAILYFIISLKFSGAEAYHQTGILSYAKWFLIGLILNIGFIFPVRAIKPIFKLIILAMMVAAVYINIVIYLFSLNSVLYNVLAIVLVVCSSLLFFDRFLSNE